MASSDNSNSTKQLTHQRLSHEITHELEQCLSLCQQLQIDFYACLAHARIEFDKHQREPSA
ncbi:MULTISPECIES: hypothetical protein [Chitinibacter]|uniref:hypothetical protein n=1 Tax=Chitinibacter TaxID=230666 RepID=UPI0004282202|nr:MULTISPECIES: hypothetical protein [Chitinibacter]